MTDIKSTSAPVQGQNRFVSLVQEWRAPIILVILVLAITPLIMGSPGSVDTSITIATLAIISLSLGICYGLGGMLSLAQATFASIGAYSTAIVVTNLGVSPWIGLPFAILVPMVIAYVIARLIVRLSPLALALATLAFSLLFQLAVNEGGDFTGGYIGLTGIPGIEPFNSMLSLHFLGWGIVLVVMLMYTRLRRSTSGRALLTISEDTVLAKSVGISVNARLSSAFALSAAVAGVGGWYYAHVRGYLAPLSLSLDLSFMIAIAVIVGGRRTILGPILGTILIVFLKDYVPGTTSHGMFYGAGLVLALLLFPEGIMGENWGERFKRWRRSRQAPETFTTSVWVPGVPADKKRETVSSGTGSEDS